MPKQQPRPDLTALAAQLDIDARTLRKWRTREDFPHGADAAAVKEWANSQGLHRIYTKGEGGTLADLKADVLRRDIQLKDLKIAAQQGNLIDRETVEEAIALIGQKWDLLLRLKLEVELGPRVAGKSAAEANVEGSRILDEIREVVNAGLARFQSDVVKQSKGRDDDE
jgi:hypothetical protein